VLNFVLVGSVRVRRFARNNALNDVIIGQLLAVGENAPLWNWSMLPNGGFLSEPQAAVPIRRMLLAT